MDPLEQFIRDNKEQLQHRAKDRDALWDKINQDIEPQKTPVVRNLNWQRWAAAASIVLAIGVGLLWMQNNNSSSVNHLAIQRSIEIMEIESHYQKLINARVSQVKNSSSLTDLQKKEIIKYLDKLEKESSDLEKELEVNINNVQIIQAIINNYRARLDVMEKLLDNSTNNKNKRHERNISI